MNLLLLRLGEAIVVIEKVFEKVDRVLVLGELVVQHGFMLPNVNQRILCPDTIYRRQECEATFGLLVCDINQSLGYA